MRAAIVRAYGPPEAVVVDDLADPVVRPGEALVDIRAASINFPDVLIINDEYQVSAPLPFVPGSEFAGVVREVGDGVDDLEPGERVVGITFVGAFSEAVVVPAAGLITIPPGATFRDAASFWVAHGTAYHALRSVGEVSAGEWVVVLGAAGGVGLAAIDVAKARGGLVVAAASNDEKLRVCRERGADATVNYATEDVKVRVRDLTNGGADIVIDPVGGRYAEPALRSLRWGGRFVVVGFASGEIPRLPLNVVLLKGLIVRGFEIRTFGKHEPGSFARDRAELRELFATGQLRPFVSQVFPLERVSEALRHVADRNAIGKVVIEA